MNKAGSKKTALGSMLKTYLFLYLFFALIAFLIGALS